MDNIMASPAAAGGATPAGAAAAKAETAVGRDDERTHGACRLALPHMSEAEARVGAAAVDTGARRLTAEPVGGGVVSGGGGVAANDEAASIV